MNFFGKALRGINGGAKKPLITKCAEVASISPPSLIDLKMDKQPLIEVVAIATSSDVTTDDDRNAEDTDDDITDDTTEDDSGIAEESMDTINGEVEKINSFTDLSSGDTMTLVQGESLNNFFTYWYVITCIFSLKLLLISIIFLIIFYNVNMSYLIHTDLNYKHFKRKTNTNFALPYSLLFLRLK